MHDITHCYGEGCPLRHTCLRYTSTTSGRRDSFTRLLYDVETQQCDYYWDERPGEESIRSRAYQLWEQTGQEIGKAEEYWFQALQELIELARNS